MEKNPLSAKEALKKTRFSSFWTHSDGEKRIQECNRLMGSYGVEAIRGDWQNGYWCDVVASYVNTGDSYDETVLWIRGDDRAGERFQVGSVGDFVERNGKRYGIY